MMRLEWWRDKAFDVAMAAVDSICAAIPQPVPPPSRLEQARVIAHRGRCGRDDGTLENTVAAIDNSLRCGSWGVEFDVRFTADGEPVLHHDPTLGRVYGQAHRIEATPLETLKRAAPSLAGLDEVTARFGKRLHMMIELKSRNGALTRAHAHRLRASLKGLEPVHDYHFMAFDAECLETVADEFAPRESLLLIAETNIARMSRTALERGYGGLTGHYLLFSERLRRRHAEAGQKVGTGFIASENCLYRELGRGVEWIYTDHAARLLEGLRARLAQASRRPPGSFPSA